MKTWIGALAITSVLLTGCSKSTFQASASNGNEASGLERIEQVLEFPSSKYPETGAHIKEAIEKGKTNICTIDRKGAAERRKQSLANVLFCASSNSRKMQKKFQRRAATFFKC